MYKDVTREGVANNILLLTIRNEIITAKKKKNYPRIEKYLDRDPILYSFGTP